MASVEADVVASIVQNLPCIAEFLIDGRRHYFGVDLPIAETVDKLLYGIVHNQSSQLTRFSTVYSVGFEAMMDLAERFPAIKVLELGYPDVPCQVSESFALACVKAFSCLPDLKTLYLHARCAEGDLSRLVSGIQGARALQSLTVDFARDP